jgi:hypothetical protein
MIDHKQRATQLLFTSVIIGVVVLAAGAGAYYLTNRNPASSNYEAPPPSYQLNCVATAYKTYAVSYTISGKPIV